MIMVITIAASSIAFGQTKMSKVTNKSVESQLIALEKAGWEAWKNKDIKLMETYYSDDALTVHVDGVTDKSQTIKSFGNCEVKSVSLDDFRFLMIDKNSALITFVGTQDAVCGGQKQPTSVRGSSVYVKRGGKWLNIYYTEIPLDYASATRRQVVNPPGISPLVPAYSVAIRQGDTVFVSGMTGIKPGTQDIVDGGVAVQTRQTLDNIRTSLQTAGATMADVGECTVFLVDMADYAAMNSAYLEFFRVDPPARATLAVSALPRPAARVEIKCSAVIARH